MKRIYKLLLSAVFISLFVLHSARPSVYAQKDIPTVKVAMSEDESIIVERILYTALKRIGYQMITNTAGMRTMVNDVNNGESAIVPAQTIGLDEEYVNLIRVPVPISYVEINVYARTGDAYDFSSWDELSGLRLSHCHKNLFVSNNVYRANASEVVVLTEYAELWQSLLNNETDVAVVPNLTGFVRVVPEGVSIAGVVQRQERYTYVNKEYEYLVPLLTQAYQSMTDDGTMEQIRSSTQSGDKKVILHISSYNSQIEWENGETDAVRNSFDPKLGFEYHNLYLNSCHVDNSADMQSIIANTIRTRFIERNPDLIIVSDNDALEFTLNNYYMLFPKVPVVFCGINNFNPSALHGFEPYVTGVTETISAYETISQMLRMYPETRRVYILNDYTNSGMNWQESLRNELDGRDLGVDIEFNKNKSFSEILTDIKDFGPDSLVLLGVYFSDGVDSFYSEREVQELVSAVSQTPVFCLANSFNGHGTLGGLVSVSTAQGEAAAEIAHKILAGTPPSQIPVTEDTGALNRWQFDYAVAEKFGINTRALPAGHTALNRSVPIWESNPFEFKLALAGVAALLLIIAGLILFLRTMRRKNAHLIELQSHLHSAEELLEKDNDLRRMTESLPVSVLIVDTKTGAPEYGNKVFLSENGMESFEQARGLDMSALINRAFNALNDNRASFQMGSLQTPDSDICQKITVERMIYHNKDCFLFISEDITAQIKEKEMLAKAAEKEREASRSKTNFLSNMSHEIRTPLTAITGMTLIGKLSPDAEKKDYAFGKIEDASSHLLNVINDILDMSKIEANKFELSAVEFDFEKMLQRVANVFSFRIDEKRLHFSIFLDKNIPRTLIGDDHRIVQVINNLMSNAIKFTPEEGSIRLDARLTDETDGVYTIQIEVTDTGIGIKPDRQARIFNSFEQAENDTTRQYGGTGLGLSISKHITELLGGKIWVESEPGKGSKFTFTIKARKGAVSAGVDKFLPKPLFPSSVKDCIDECAGFENITESSKAPVETASYAGKRILLAEDVEINREIVKALFEPTNIEFHCAENGEEAVKMFSDSPDSFDLILMDLQMPKMGGLEATKRIRELGFPKAANIPIIAMTANVFREDVEQCMNAGMNDHVSKPLDFDEISGKVKLWLK